MPHLVTHEGEILTSHSEVERKACPFYGFLAVTMDKIMLDQGGNKCALLINSYTPCQMEYSKQKTDWNKCDYNNPKMINRLGWAIEDVMIFPREFAPKDGDWRGIKLTDWIKYTQDRD